MAIAERDGGGLAPALCDARRRTHRGDQLATDGPLHREVIAEEGLQSADQGREKMVLDPIANELVSRRQEHLAFADAVELDRREPLLERRRRPVPGVFEGLNPVLLGGGGGEHDFCADAESGG
jgi:hypothetical protein